MEGKSKTRAETVLRAQQTSGADNPLLRRERSDETAGVLLEEHTGVGVRLFVRRTKKKSGKKHGPPERRGLTKESSELRFGGAAHARTVIGLEALTIIIIIMLIDIVIQ